MRKSYTPTFKAKLVQELLKEEKTLAQLAAEHGVHPNQLRQWKNLALEGLPNLFERDKANRDQQLQNEAEREALYAQIGRLTTELIWLKKKSGLLA